ncbi:MAG: histidine kinase, partial [Caulobacteraceae bacterium]|nr:histidine kinase [Caulobacteraceae bacterium]
PPWSDLPIVLLTQRGGGPEQNPVAMRLSQTLGNVSFLERPFHPTTLISLMRVALRGRGRQYEARERIETIRAAEDALRIANTDLEERVEERTARLLAAESALRQSQKLEAIGQLTGGVAHDFNNLLMVISGGLEVMDKQRDPERRSRIVTGMRQAADRGAKLTKQLLSFSRTQPLKAEPVDLIVQVEGMKTLLDHALSGDIGVDSDMAVDLWPVEVDPSELELVILNLCVNARDAMPDGGRVRISGRNHRTSEGDFVQLRISDTGVGMTDEVKTRVFEPFYTTKEVGKGSGLGLAQVYGFARQSGGSVEIESAVGKGSTIILTLPRSKTPPPVPAQIDDSPLQNRGLGELVLVVEDDDAVATLVAEMLSQIGYGCERVDTAAAAIATLSKNHPIGAVFSDVMMPGGMSGIDLAGEIHRRWPGLPVVLTSGFAAAFEDRAQAEGVRLLPKPYGPADLAGLLHAAINAERNYQ